MRASARALLLHEGEFSGEQSRLKRSRSYPTSSHVLSAGSATSGETRTAVAVRLDLSDFRVGSARMTDKPRCCPESHHPILPEAAPPAGFSQPGAGVGWAPRQEDRAVLCRPLGLASLGRHPQNGTALQEAAPQAASCTRTDHTTVWPSPRSLAGVPPVSSGAPSPPRLASRGTRAAVLTFRTHRLETK